MKKNIISICENVFLGRDKELKSLSQFYSCDLDEGGIAILIEGDIGTGKTTLVKRFLDGIPRKAGRDPLVMKTAGQHFLSTSEYHIIKQILVTLTGVDSKYSRTRNSKIISEYIAGFNDSELKPLISLFKYVLETRITNKEKLFAENLKTSDRFRLLNKLLIILLKQVSKRKKIILVFNNFQWIDSYSLKFIKSLMTNLKDSPVMFLLLSRSKVQFDDFKFTEQFFLKPYDKKLTSQYIKKIFSVKSVENITVDLIYKISSGNPQHLKYLLSYLQKTENIKLTKTRFSIPNKKIPETGIKLIKQKMNLLTKNQQEFLNKAAVFGKDFPGEILLNSLADRKQDEGEILALKNSCYIQKENIPWKVFFLKTDFCFTDLFLQENIYLDLSPKNRIQYHEFWGNLLEEYFDKEDINLINIIIYHYRISNNKGKLIHYLKKIINKKLAAGYFQNALNLFKEWENIIGEDAFKTRHGVEQLMNYIELLAACSMFKEALDLIEKTELKAGNLITSYFLPESLSLKGRILGSIGNISASIETLNSGISIISNIQGDYRKNLSDCHNGLGLNYLKLARFKDAEKAFSESLKIRQEIYGKNHPEYAKLCLNLGISKSNQAQYKDALRYYKKAEKIYRSKFGKLNPYLASITNNIGTVYYYMGDLDNAFKKYKIALNQYLSFYGDEHLYISYSYFNMGIIAHDKQEYDTAEQFYNKALNIRKKVLGKEHISTSNCFQSLGKLYADKGNLRMAMDYFQHALKIKLKTLDHNHPELASIYYDLGNVCIESKRYDQAKSYLDTALTIYNRALGPDHPDTGKVYILFGKNLFAQNKYQDAMGYFTKALKILLDKRGADNLDVKKAKKYLKLIKNKLK